MSQIFKVTQGTGAAPIEYIDVHGTHVIPDGTGGITLTNSNRNFSIIGAGSTIDLNLIAPTNTGLVSWLAAAPYVDYTTTPGTFSTLVIAVAHILDAPILVAAQSVGGIAIGTSYYITATDVGGVGLLAADSPLTVSTNKLYLGGLFRTASGDQYFSLYNWSSYNSGLTKLVDTLHHGFARFTDDVGGIITDLGASQVSLTAPYKLITPTATVTVTTVASPLTFHFFYLNAGGLLDRHAITNTFPAVYNNAGVVTPLVAGQYSVMSIFVGLSDGNTTDMKYFAIIGNAAYADLSTAYRDIAYGTYKGSGALTQLALVRAGYIIMSGTTGIIGAIVVDKETTAVFEYLTDKNRSILLPTSTTNFNNNLSTADKTVQAALDTLDDKTFVTTFTTSDTIVTPPAAGGNINLSPGYNTHTTGNIASNTIRVHLNTSIQLPNSDSTAGKGIYYLGATCAANACTGGTHFLHNSGTDNTFVGSNAGNLAPDATANAMVAVGTDALKSAITNSPGCVGIGYKALEAANNTAIGHVAIGYMAGNKLTGAMAQPAGCVAIGYKALQNATGTTYSSIAIGTQCLETCVDGMQNLGIGFLCLGKLTNSIRCLAFGNSSLYNITTGSQDTVAIGHACAFNLTSSVACVIVGQGALRSCTGSSTNSIIIGEEGASFIVGNHKNNILIGQNVASNYITTESSNIVISNAGSGGESNVIRIGTNGSNDGQQDKCYIAGIYGTATIGATQGVVIIDSTHKLASVAQLGVPLGGTGAATFTQYGVLLGNGTGAIQVTAAGTTNTVLLGNTGANPSWGTVPNAALTNSSVTLTSGNNITVTGSPLSLGGAATIAVSGTTQYALQVGSAAGALSSLAIGNAGQILTSVGAGADPAWTTTTYPATSTKADIIYASANNAYGNLAFVNTATRYLANTGTGATLPEWNQVNLANGVTGVLPQANGGTGTTTYVTGIAWSEVTDATKQMEINNGYVADNAAQVVFTLPATAALGSIVRVIGKSASGWRVGQNAGQTIYWGDAIATTGGVLGYIESTSIYDAVELVCITANFSWSVLSSKGNINVV